MAWYWCIIRTGPGRTSILGTRNFVRLRRARALARAYGPKNRGRDHPFYELYANAYGGNKIRPRACTMN